MLIQKTMDFRIFGKVIGNREIKKAHVNNLVLSIQKNNLLQYNPIIVNSQMEIIDGQHRLEAARELKTSIYYVIVDSASLKDIQLLNTNNMKWTTQDYLESYIALGKPEYIKLKDFSQEYDISIYLSILILSNAFKKKATPVMQEFRAGNFKIENYQNAENVASLVGVLRKFCKNNAFASRTFITAVAKVIDKGLAKKLVDKLTLHSFEIERVLNVRDYYRQFEDIMNYKVREENETRLY